jgi:hypothetical protein
MIEILGKKFLTTKEASKRYGMSEAWFQKRRERKLRPSYTKIENSDRVWYPLVETDQWFEHQIRMKEGA